MKNRSSRRIRRSISRVLSSIRRCLYGHSSGTIVADRLTRPTRMAMRKHICRHLMARPAIPIWSCSRWGLPCRVRCRPRGALLPHPFTLTRRPKRTGGLLSVALSLGSPPPGVTRHRVSVEPGLSSSGWRRERPSDRLIGARDRAGKEGGQAPPSLLRKEY